MERAAKKAELSKDLNKISHEEVDRVHRLIKPIKVFPENEVYHHVQVRLAEERSSAVQNVPRLEKKDNTETNVKFSDIDKTRRDRSVRKHRLGRKGH